MKPIYSIRSSLGRELWWTTGRKSAIRLAEELNAIGVGAAVRSSGTGTADSTRAYKSPGTRGAVREGLSAHELPVAVYRCSILATKTPEQPARPLSERRAADREMMAARLIDAAVKAGASGTRDNSLRGDRRIDVLIEVPGGAFINVDFDGRSVQPDVFVQTWNVERAAYNAGVRLRDWEGYATAKRNTVARGFDQLVSMLVGDITALISGDGYWK